MTSIRRRLLVGLLGTLLLVWALTGIWVYRDAHHEVEEVFDAHLAQYARVLLSLVSQSARDGGEVELQRVFPFTAEAYVQGLDGAPLGHKYERKLAFQLWSDDGELLLRTPEAPMLLQPPASEGYAAARFGGHNWRLFSLRDPYAGLAVQVAERDDVRGDMIGKIVRQQLAPALVALPVMALLIWFGIGRGLQPLQRVTREVTRRAPDQLEPLREDDAPREIAPLTAALNELFRRLDRAFARERRFTADAAHELRTPLAGLKTQAQVALGADDPAGREHALRQILRGVDRASHLVQQLLTLARLEPDTVQAGQGLELRPLDLRPLVEEVVEQVAASAAAQGQALQTRLESVQVAGDVAALAVLTANLLNNALRYTPAGGRVELRLSDDGAGARLEVADSGPGIPPEQRERVFERFYRGLGHGYGGSGLGLAIVRQIAALHHAEVVLGEATLGGLLATVRFPPLTAAGGGQGQERP